MALILVSSPETCGDVQARVESTPCTPSTKTEPDSRGLVPAIHVFICACAANAWMPGTSPGMTSEGMRKGFTAAGVQERWNEDRQVRVVPGPRALSACGEELGDRPQRC